MPQPNRDLTDWDRIKREIAENAPIPYDGNDADDCPYDPNDDEAVDQFLTENKRIEPAPSDKKKIA
jgi:hypothetical protein